MEIKSAIELNKFRDTVDECVDKEMIEAAVGVLNDLLTINRLKKEIQALEGNMYDGARSLFYFLALPLSEDEIVFAAERANGRLKRMQRAEDLKKEKEEKDKLELSESE